MSNEKIETIFILSVPSLYILSSLYFQRLCESNYLIAKKESYVYPKQH